MGASDASPLPRLNIVPSSGAALISWPLYAADFLLEQSDLSGPIVWNPAPYAYTTNATGIGAAAIALDAGRFFRLRK